MKFEIKNSDLLKLLHDTQINPRLTDLRWKNRAAEGQRYTIIAAPPKSGSTWITNVLAKSLQLQVRRYCYAWSSNEHDIYVPALLANAQRRTISQLHMRATPHNVQLIVDFNINTVIITRNVYDTVVSFARDLMKKKDANIKTTGLDGYAFVWLNNCKKDWGIEQYIDYSIKYYLPWYINFLSSWSAYKDLISGICVRYEKLRECPEEVFGGVIEKIDAGKILHPSFNENHINSSSISGTNSETGSSLDILSKGQKLQINSFFEGMDDAWVKSHLNTNS